MVVARDDDAAWVETQRRSACGGCNSEKGCGTALLAQVFGGRPARVRARDPLGAEPGEWVILGLDEAVLLKTSLALYLIPILGLLLGAALGAAAPLGHNDLWSVSAGALGLIAGLLLARRLTLRVQDDPRHQAVVLRRLTPRSGAVPLPLPSRTDQAVS